MAKTFHSRLYRTAPSTSAGDMCDAPQLCHPKEPICDTSEPRRHEYPRIASSLAHELLIKSRVAPVRLMPAVDGIIAVLIIDGPLLTVPRLELITTTSSGSSRSHHCPAARTVRITFQRFVSFTPASHGSSCSHHRPAARIVHTSVSPF